MAATASGSSWLPVAASGRGACWSPPGSPTSFPASPASRPGGHDVLHCPYCHGHEVLDHQLGVIGGTPGAVRYAQIVRQWTHDLVYFTPPGLLTAAERAGLVARAIGIVEGTIAGLIIDDDRLRGVCMAEGSTVPRDALFVPPPLRPRSRLLADLGCAIDDDG